jgi:hypothetical protein
MTGKSGIFLDEWSQTQSSDVFKRSATCWGVSKGSFSRQSLAGTTGFGIVAMFAINSRTKYRPFASSTSGPQGGTLLARTDRRELYLFLPSPARRIQGVPETVPDHSRKLSVEGRRAFLGRFIVTSSAASAIELGYFFASSKNFSVEISGSG